MGYDQHWSFGVQQQVAKSMVVDVEYVGNKGSHIQGNDVFNIPEPAAGQRAGEASVPAVRQLRLHSSDTSSSYHALQAKFERRASAGLWLLTSYTFSKSLWNANTRRSAAYAFETGPSEYHVPHTFSLRRIRIAVR